MLSFRTRLALAHLAAIVGVLTVAALGAYWTLARTVHGQLDAALLAVAETEIGMLTQEAGEPVRVHEVPPGPATPSFSFVRLDRLVQIVDARGSVLARSANLGESRLPTPPGLLKRLAAGETVFETLADFGEEPTRVVSVPVRAGGELRTVQVAGSLDDVNNVVKSAALLFVVMGCALLITVGSAGTLLTRRAFRAIDQLVRQARGIGEANLGERLPHPGTQDEIGRLVDTLNAMLGRLEQSFEVQRRFTADASHELRSPLSRLRIELEVALRRPRSTSDYVETLRSCLEEVQRLTRLVEELLALARIDAGQEQRELESVPLHRLAQEAVVRLERFARERDVHITLEQSSPATACVVHAPATLVLVNLLDNAVKFSPRGARVTVRTGTEGKEAVVSVCDSGPGIRLDELPQLFERFYRGFSPHAVEADGVGLGLALSQAVAKAHGGRIEASNLPAGGALFTLHLPLAA